MSNRYAETDCVDLQRRGLRTKIGVICVSGDKALLADMGIDGAVRAPGTVEKGTPPSSPGLIVSTPMAQYEMRPLDFAHGRAATADVDCDVGRGAIYRATGTCRVTVVERGASGFIYSNLVMTDHVRKKAVMSTTQAESIVMQLDRP